MARGSKRAKSGGANQAFLRRDREQKEQASTTKTETEGDDTKADNFDDAYVSFLSKANQNQSDDSNSEDDHAYDLAVGGTSSEDEEDDVSSSDSNNEEDDDDNSDDDASDDEITGNLKRLVDDLPASLRQKVLMGQKIEVDSEIDSDGDNTESNKLSKLTNADAAAVLAGSWGKKKHYWHGDTADLEIGQDMQDAIDEEKAANELQENRLRVMGKQDYGSSDESDSGDESDNAGRNVKSTGILGSTVLGNIKSGDVSVHAVNRDLSKLSKSQRLRLLALDAPELLAVVSGMQQKKYLAELQEVIIPLREFLNVEDVKAVYGASLSPELADTEVSVHMIEREKAVIDYIHLKEQLLSSFLSNLLFLMSMHAEGMSTRSHPVMKQLLELQYALNKMTVLDKDFHADKELLIELRSQHLQLDGTSKRTKAKRAATPTLSQGITSIRASLGLQHRHYLPSSEDNYESSADASSMNAAEDADDVADDSSDAEYDTYVREEERMNSYDGNKRRKRISEKREESNSGSDDSDGDVLDMEMPPSAEQQKSKKQALKMSLSAFGGAYAKDVAGRSKKGSDDMLFTGDNKPTKIIKNYADVDDEDDFVSKKRKTEEQSEESDLDNESALDEINDMLSNSNAKGSVRRRPAPETDNDMHLGSDADDGAEALYEAFTEKKKNFLKEKREHYKPEARYGGMFDMNTADIVKGRKNQRGDVQEQGAEGASKRAATYEMIKNKGLTPHRKKANRNPRVKKRMAYDKALVARRGQVREVNTSGVNTASAYSGETTGIKANISRSRKIST